MSPRDHSTSGRRPAESGGHARHGGPADHPRSGGPGAEADGRANAPADRYEAISDTDAAAYTTRPEEGRWPVDDGEAEAASSADPAAEPGWSGGGSGGTDDELAERSAELGPDADPDADRRDDEMDAFFPSVARAAATGQDIASILDEELLVKALAERDEYLDALRRLQADFENFRKRTDRQLDEVRSRASESLLERLLPVVDAFDLAVAHLGGGAASAHSASGQSLRELPGESEALAALVQVGGLLRDTLAKEGLERIDAVGVAFDPTVHDAVARAEPAEGDEPGAVVDEVMRAGYLLKGRVLRPAMVKVRG
jgi:molecular chaperone GrpE